MKRQSGSHDRHREARLLAAASHLYPGITAGVWIQAASMADVVWAQRLQRGEHSSLRDRVLNPEHFEFRYGAGAPTESAPLRRRATDSLRLQGD